MEAIDQKSLFAVHVLELPLLLLRSAAIGLECRMQNRNAVLGLYMPVLNCVRRCVSGNAVCEFEPPLLVWNLPLLS